MFNKSEIINRLSARKSTLEAQKKMLEWQASQSYVSAQAESIGTMDKQIAGLDLQIRAAKGDTEAEKALAESKDKLNDMFSRMRGGGKGAVEAHAEIVALRQTQINNHIMASSTALPFFNVQNLADNERPEYKHTTRQFEVGVTKVGQGGQPQQMQVVKRDSHVDIDMYPLSTDEIEFPLWDFARGDISQQSVVTQMAAEDLELEQDAILWTALKAKCASFDLTNSVPALRTYTQHSRIPSGQFPTTNVLDASSAGRWSYDAIKLIYAYLDSWADKAPELGGIMNAVEIHIPSKDASGMLADITPSTQITDQSLSGQVRARGYIYDVGGRQFMLRPNIHLSSADNAAYVRVNAAVGDVFFKPGFNERLSEIKLDVRGNKGSAVFGRLWGAAIPNIGATRIIKVTYKS